MASVEPEGRYQPISAIRAAIGQKETLSNPRDQCGYLVGVVEAGYGVRPLHGVRRKRLSLHELRWKTQHLLT